MVSKNAHNISNFRNEIYFTLSARKAWEQILNFYGPNIRILLPAYIGYTIREGSGIWDPVETSNVDYAFYQLNKNLSVDIEFLENQLCEQKFDLILIVHYFGFQGDNLLDVINLCRENEIIIVEDCAHLFGYNSSKTSAGNYGDFSFYSLHKNFPANYGGLLKVNTSTKNKWENLEDKNLIELFSHYDVDKIIEQKICNYNYALLRLNEIKEIAPICEYKIGDVPHTLPVIVNNGLREKLYFWLIENDVTLTALYYQLIQNLGKKDYPEMHYISTNILNIPLHQDISHGDLDFIFDKIEAGLKILQN